MPQLVEITWSKMCGWSSSTQRTPEPTQHADRRRRGWAQNHKNTNYCVFVSKRKRKPRSILRMFRIIKQSLLFVALLPGLVTSHGCTGEFEIESFANRSLLNLDTTLVPQAIQDFPNGYDFNATFYGVYDCHHGDGMHKVGMSAICDNATSDCICVAQYQLVDCKTCTLHGYALEIESFSADCSGIKEGLPNCTVEVGLETSGCFVESGNNDTEVAGSIATRVGISAAFAVLFSSAILHVW